MNTQHVSVRGGYVTLVSVLIITVLMGIYVLQSSETAQSARIGALYREESSARYARAWSCLSYAQGSAASFGFMRTTSYAVPSLDCTVFEKHTSTAFELFTTTTDSFGSITLHATLDAGEIQQVTILPSMPP